MINPVKVFCKIILAAAALGLSGFQIVPKTDEAIVLHDEPAQINPKEFYIAGLIDKRDDRSAVAWILRPVDIKNPSIKAFPVDFQGGGFAALKGFVDRNVRRNTAMRPIKITLKKFSVTESVLSGNVVQGRVNLVMSFNLDDGNEETIHLTDYNGTAVYNRTAGSAQEVEPTMRALLMDGLTYLNNWVNQQADTNIKLAKGVKVIFTDYEERPEGDSIYYAVKRPLTWDDFQSKIPGSKYEAEVFPTLGYDERTAIVKGVVQVHLAIKVCLPKSASWAKAGSRNDYTLNHEQRHFDIVKIAAEHFKQRIKAENLTVGNYDGPINVDYLDAYREMTNLQKQYDDETHHGMDVNEQQKWNLRIDQELSTLKVK